MNSGKVWAIDIIQKWGIKIMSVEDLLKTMLVQKEPEIVNFEQGVNIVVNQIMNSEESPYLVVITGIPHSGKTEFGKRVYRILEKKGKLGLTLMCGDPIDYNFVGDRGLDYCIVEDVDYTSRVNGYMRRNFDGQCVPDSNLLIAIDLSEENLPIYAPMQMESSTFDFVVLNPEARM